jgi:hypothetical protein
MAKKDAEVEDFNLDEIPDDDGAELFGESGELEESSEEEPEGKSSANSKSKKSKKQTDESEKSEEDDENQETEEEVDDDFSDLGFDKDDEAGDKPKTQKILGKFKDEKALADGYTNLEKELGRLRNEVTELKKNPPKSDEKPDDNKETIDLMKIIDVNQLNDLILTSDKPGEAILQTIAKAFNALQTGAVKQVTKLIEDQNKTYQEKYFNEIDQNREAQEKAKPFKTEAARLAKKYHQDWVTVRPWMEKAIENNPDLVTSPDDYEPLYKRCKDYLTSKGKLEEIEDKETSRKKSGGLSGSKGRNMGHFSGDEEQEVLANLFPE